MIFILCRMHLASLVPELSEAQSIAKDTLVGVSGVRQVCHMSGVKAPGCPMSDPG